MAREVRLWEDRFGHDDSSTDGLLLLIRTIAIAFEAKFDISYAAGFRFVAFDTPFP